MSASVHLQALGLTEYESRAYTALLSLGQAAPARIARQAAIPRPKIYETLERLEGRGLASKIQTNPIEYAPLSAREYLERSRREFDNRLNLLEREMARLTQEGVGIADEWDGNASDEKHWRDSHYRLEGPTVAQMQAAFMDNWIKTSGQVLQGEEYFPKLEAHGTVLAQVFTSSPEGGGDSMQLMYLMAIAAAERSIDISAAYFVPDKLIRDGIEAALKRGVKVRILVPGALIDSQVVRKASRSQWGEMLQAGAEIREYQPSLFHCKLLVVDRQLVSVGSTNFDNRSFRLNDEANLNVYDKAFAEHILTVYEADLKKSQLITYEAWKNRPWTDKFVEKISSIFSSQL